MEKEVYTVEEAALISGLSETDIREAIRNNLLVAQKSENLGDFVIRRDDLEIFIKLHRTGTKIIEKKRILIVDDEFDYCRLLKIELERKNKLLDVKIATSGKDAVALAQKFKPHIMLLDFMLPDITGEEVLLSLSELKKTTGVKVIVYSAYAKELITQSPGLLERLNCLGSEVFIDKTKGTKHLMQEVNKILAQPP